MAAAVFNTAPQHSTHGPGEGEMEVTRLTQFFDGANTGGVFLRPARVPAAATSRAATSFLLGKAAALIAALILFVGGMGVSLDTRAQGMTVFNNSCSTNGTGCHAFPPEGARLNAANASAVIVQANTTHGMGFSAGFMTANAGNIATYIGTLITGSQTVNVNYHATVGFAVNDIVLNNGGGGIITTINQVSAPARGNMLGSGTASPSYQHTANNCTSDSFQVRGQGLQNTSNRTINITVNAPSAPVAANTATTIAYNTGAQSINLSALGALSGTAPLTNVSRSAVPFHSAPRAQKD